jgi:hypothetical protein
MRAKERDHLGVGSRGELIRLKLSCGGLKRAEMRAND